MAEKSELDTTISLYFYDTKAKYVTNEQYKALVRFCTCVR
jgi:hypothetical protein